MKIAAIVSRIMTLVVLLAAASAQAASDATLKALWQRAELGETLTPAEKAELEPFVRAMERRTPETIDAVGGPDGYGYYYVDNQNGDSTTYAWIELRGDGQATWIDFENADDGTADVPLSFYFPFYGENYTSLNVCTNGFITFENNRISSAFNQCLPAAGLGGPGIAMFWDDLHLHYGGNNVNNNTVVWRDFGDYIVVQYDEIGHYGFPTPPSDHFTFQCILYANGGIKLQYQSMNYSEYSSSQTVGIQQNTGGTMLEYVCNSGSPTDGRAIWYYRGGYGSLMGNVSSGGQPVYNATVVIEESELYASTDGNGNFFFPVAPVGSFTVTARMFGFAGHTQANVAIHTNQWTNRLFTLTTVPVIDFSVEDASFAIPDRDTVYATLNVTDNVTISGCAVGIDQLTHSYVGDLQLWLESPWGERVYLSNRNGGSGDNMVDCQLDDQAGQSIADGHAPFTGRYWAETSLGSFNNSPSRGLWTLVCYDAANQDEGVLNDWSLRFTGEQIPEGHVWGNVNDMLDDPVAGCEVLYAPMNLSTTTDADGWWELYLPVGTCELEFSAGGYCDYATQINVANNGNHELNVQIGAPNGHSSVDFLSQQGVAGELYNQDFQLINDGDCEWSYSIVVLDADWLTVSPEIGSVGVGSDVTITATFNTTGMPGGVYSCEIEVSHNGTMGRITIPVILDLATAADPAPAVPEAYVLRGNYPNPFNGQTEIAFDLPNAGHVTMTVHNLLGQQVATILNETRNAGFHRVNWAARSEQGVDLTTGLYFLRVNMGGRDYVTKMILTR